MPFFNFRRTPTTSPNAGAAAQPESMEVVRKRAKHRLIGAAVLVLVGVVGFPLLFDTQPRPIAVDIPIEIPGKNAVKPLVMPAKPEAAQQAVPPVADKVAAASSLGSKEEIVSDKKSAPDAAVMPLPKKEINPTSKSEPKPDVKPDTRPDARPEAKSDVKSEPKPDVKPEVKPEVKAESKLPPKLDAKPAAEDGARAKALLDGQSTAAAAPASTERLVVQVGAFADADKAQEVRLKLERAGLKTYTQVADTKDGKRTRVRVGPFASRGEADKAASKIKTLDLPAAILTL